MPSEGMVTDVVPDAEMGVVLVFWRAAMAGVARESRAVQVRPRARTFKTTPTMIWSTPYFTEKSASREPSNAPASGAATRPA